jgi:glycerate-2-kinase
VNDPAPAGVRADLEAIFHEAVAAVDAAEAVRRQLVGTGERRAIAGVDLVTGARVVLLAVGKAAASMATAFAEWAGDALVEGLVVTKEGHAGGAGSIPALRVLETAHPVPDARCAAAAREALALVERADPDHLLVVLLSGGASSLVACPVSGVEAEDLAETTRLLLEGGADIFELNTVRKHLAELAGGKLARRAAARRIQVLTVSDVPGDRLDVIGSGPLAGDPSRFSDAIRILWDREIWESVPERVRRHLEAGVRGEADENPKPGDADLERVRTRIVASNRVAVEAARDAAVRRGWKVQIVSTPLEGEARDAARALVALGKAAAAGAPLLLLAGGETVVTVRGAGKGGRNQELALAAALAMSPEIPMSLLAAGTDGSDGPTDAAGAFVDSATVRLARERGLDAARSLEDNDSYAFFSAAGGLFRTGPTGTNVMDLALLAVGAPGAA